MYSQYLEETAILAAFPESHGRLLDIGAYHPTDKSNSRALYERGWSCVMIEPAPGPMHALLKEYGNEPRITLIQAAVAHEAGIVPMWISDDAVSTTEDSQHEVWKDAGGYFGRLYVPTITLEQISNQFGGADFINLDVEGRSVDLFLRACALGWEPRAWCVEHDNRLAELLSMATEKGYMATMTNACNVVLVKK